MRPSPCPIPVIHPTTPIFLVHPCLTVSPQVEVQASLLELLAPVEAPSGGGGTVSGSETIRWRAACRPVLRLLRRQGGGEKKLRGSCLLQEYVDLAKGGGSPGAVRLLQEFDHPATASVEKGIDKGKGKRASAASVSASTGDPASRRAELLAAYCDRLLAGSKERPTSAALGAYRRLVASVTAEEFEAKVCACVGGVGTWVAGRRLTGGRCGILRPRGGWGHQAGVEGAVEISMLRPFKHNQEHNLRAFNSCRHR